MSKYRQAAKVDANQSEIVGALRGLPGVQVEVGHDDILVGYRDKTYWYELKTMDTWKKNGGIRSGTFKESQVGLIKNWTGHYRIVWTLEQILTEIGFK